MVSNGLLHGGLYRQVGEITVRKLNIVVLSGLLCVLSLHVCVLYLKMIFLHAWFVSVCYNLGFQISDLERVSLVKSMTGNTG